ncbi:MAG: 4-(cytidine 5'-diphospho)-2-C-methyl-D-erythritol kinase [Luteitalea sp.]|nr:4-(cytidine 5'-diphospho)-2-C-methyl-D-erythritol kinase [Luteitalea sp.]
MATPPLIVRAHAKVNLDFRILGARSDGYHEVSTVLQSLALGDEIELHEREGPFTLTCDEPSVAADATNLVWRAAARLGAALGLSLDGLAVGLRKRIPARAGLGGGSADAGAILRLLAQRWRVAPDDPVLPGVAGELGADVPFFLVGGTALATGRGDLIQPLADLPEHQVLVVLPPFGISTQDAYTWLDAASIPPHEDASDARAEGRAYALPELVGPTFRLGSSTAGPAWSRLLPQLRNDLEAIVTARHPEIGTAVGALRAAGALLAIMTGSGSAVVGLFRADADMEEACRSLGPTVSRPGWRLLRTKTIGRQTYEASLLAETS